MYILYKAPVIEKSLSTRNSDSLSQYLHKEAAKACFLHTHYLHTYVHGLYIHMFTYTLFTYTLFTYTCLHTHCLHIHCYIHIVYIYVHCLDTHTYSAYYRCTFHSTYLIQVAGIVEDNFLVHLIVLFGGRQSTQITKELFKQILVSTK